MEKQIRVLVVDDSPFMRKALREMLEQDPRIKEVCVARNAEEASEYIKDKLPNVITIDLFMPGKDGVTFIREQMASQPLAIVVCSSAESNTQAAIDAMEAGAIEFVRKPTAMALDKMYNIKQELTAAVLAAASVPLDKLPVPDQKPAELEKSPVLIPTSYAEQRQIDAILIGISTGGPSALRAILPKFPADLPVPIAVVLHLPVGYTYAFAQKLNQICQVEVLESDDGLMMKPGRVILAQAGLHTLLTRSTNGSVVTQLSKEPLKSLYTPSVDELFRTGADVYHGRVMGVVLTGMGNDGTAGAGWIKANGGKVIAESEISSVVYGMPRSVIEAGLADRILPLNKIPDAIMEELL
jgi:two-component system, chemotaxis family, protein-glutamate methylesterase/glutaminase